MSILFPALQFIANIPDHNSNSKLWGVAVGIGVAIFLTSFLRKADEKEE